MQFDSLVDTVLVLANGCTTQVCRYLLTPSSLSPVFACLLDDDHSTSLVMNKKRHCYHQLEVSPTLRLPHYVSAAVPQYPPVTHIS